MKLKDALKLKGGWKGRRRGQYVRTPEIKRKQSESLMKTRQKDKTAHKYGDAFFNAWDLEFGI